MTVDSVAPSERSLVRFATPYLEVETQSISSLERVVVREPAHARLAPRRKKRKDGDQPSSIRTRLVEETRVGGVGRGGKSVSMRRRRGGSPRKRGVQR
jgi:hypothetical protein